MPNDPILHLLGLARKAGKLELGEEPVGAACRARHARLILLAADAAPNTCRRAAHFGEAGNVLWLTLPHTKQELGLLFGRGSCAMLAITDFGFAAAVGEKLALLDPERCGPAAGQLREKADRALQRQKEKRRHEKNLLRGKKHPWAPPPKEDPRPLRRAQGGPPPKGEHRPPRKEQDALPRSGGGRGGQAGRPAGGARPTAVPRPKEGPRPPKPAPPRKPAPGARRLTGNFQRNPRKP